MRRWSRAGTGVFTAAVLAVLGGAALVPSTETTTVVPAARFSTVVKASPVDRIVSASGAQGDSFAFRPASGDEQTPFGFVSVGGSVQARSLGAASSTVAPVSTETPVPEGRISATATTYKTTLRIDSEQPEAWHALFNVWNQGTWTYLTSRNPQGSLSTSVNLPAGKYFVSAIYGGFGGSKSYLLTKSFTVSNKAQTVHLSEKATKEVAIKVDDATAKLQQSAVWLMLPNDHLVGFAGGNGSRTYTTTTSVPGSTLRTHAVLAKAGATAFKPSPYRYDLTTSWSHPRPSSLTKTVKTASLARTTLQVRAQGSTTDATYWTAPLLGESSGVGLASRLRAPATVTEYVTPGLTMSRSLDYDNDQVFNLPDRSLPAGTSAGEVVGAGPLNPAPPSADRPGSSRNGNKLTLRETGPFDDAAGHPDTSTDVVSTTTLSSGGKQLGTTEQPSLSLTVSPVEQTYRLENTTVRNGPWSQLSNEIRSEWTFVSNQSYGVLSLIDLAVTAGGLDRYGRAGTSPVTVSVTPSTRDTGSASTVTAVDWSTDDGATWKSLPLSPSGQKVETSFSVPATAAFVSLRLTAENDEGVTLTRTLSHALAGPATPRDRSTGGTKVSAVKVNGGKPLIVGTPSPAEMGSSITTTFTVSSAATRAGVVLWHGSRKNPDAVLRSDATCAPSTRCSAEVYLWDLPYDLRSNVLAGKWQAEVWASASDGTALVDNGSAGSLTVVRDTRLTAKASPSTVQKGKTTTITGALTRADWGTWSFKPYASRTVTLQQIKNGKWTDVKKVKADTKGNAKATVKVTAAASFRWIFTGDSVSGRVTGPTARVKLK